MPNFRGAKISGKCNKVLIPVNAIQNPVRGGLVMHRPTLLHLGTVVVTQFLPKLWTFRPTFDLRLVGRLIFEYVDCLFFHY